MYELPTEEEKKTSKMLNTFGNVGNFIFNSIEAVILAAAVAIVLYLFLLTPHEVVGLSMYPNFNSGQLLLANKVIYKLQEPKRGDVIIFSHSPTQDYIKRIIGVPGDTVSVRDGKLILNGDVLDESEYLSSTIYTRGVQYLQEGETITVKEGELFVCGDNREHSSDSRDFGPIKNDQVKGKAWIVFWPFSDFKLVKHANY